MYSWRANASAGHAIKLGASTPAPQRTAVLRLCRRCGARVQCIAGSEEFSDLTGSRPSGAAATAFAIELVFAWLLLECCAAGRPSGRPRSTAGLPGV